MLRTLENLLGYRVMGHDGEIGRLWDFFLDDGLWRLRYAVAETGFWLNRRRVLIAPAAFVGVSADRREVQVNLTRQQVQAAPEIDVDQPVSRQQESLMNKHYGWPAYWSPENALDCHLRSFRELGTYDVKHANTRLGRLADLVADDDNWALTHLVMVDGDWLDHRLVCFSTGHVQQVSWTGQTISVELSRAEMARRRPFEYGYPVSRQERVLYFDYRGQPVGGRS